MLLYGLAKSWIQNDHIKLLWLPGKKSLVEGWKLCFGTLTAFSFFFLFFFFNRKTFITCCKDVAKRTNNALKQIQQFIIRTIVPMVPEGGISHFSYLLYLEGCHVGEQSAAPLQDGFTRLLRQSLRKVLNRPITMTLSCICSETFS